MRLCVIVYLLYFLCGWRCCLGWIHVFEVVTCSLFSSVPVGAPHLPFTSVHLYAASSFSLNTSSTRKEDVTNINLLFLCASQISHPRSWQPDSADWQKNRSSTFGQRQASQSASSGVLRLSRDQKVIGYLSVKLFIISRIHVSHDEPLDHSRAPRHRRHCLHPIPISPK